MNTTTPGLLSTERISVPLCVTEHALFRARQRLGWSASTVVKMADRALRAGFAPGDAKGPLKYFLASKAAAQIASCPFLYGDNVFVFRREVDRDLVRLLTIYRAPNALLRVLSRGPKIVQGKVGPN